jgi:hypothetical protein
MPSARINPAKAWCFTLNNWTDSEYGALVQRFSESGDEYFFIVGKEVGESGTPHLQGYIEKRTGRFRPLPKFQVLRDGKNAVHFERAKGNRKQNFKYCSKDDNFTTNIPRPLMTYSEAKEIWKTTEGISSVDVDAATVNEAAMHIIMVEDYISMSDSDQVAFRKSYDEMMKTRYPER